MRRTIISIIISLTLIQILTGEQIIMADFYVATSGNDKNAGTKDKPFATITRARDAVRELIKAGLETDVRVLVRGGIYELDEPLTFNYEDSGTEEHSITYMAYPGESVIVSGGRHITGWQRGEGSIWTAHVPYVKWYFRQLFVNGRRATRARTPNKDANPPCWQLKGASLSNNLKTHTYQFAPGQLKQWKNLSDVEAVVFGNWATTRKRFQSVDLNTGVATMAGPHAKPHNAIAPSPGRWFYIEDAYEALDQPGEWYLDRKTGILSYWPLPGDNLKTAEVVAPKLTRLLEVKGTPEQPVRNLHFVGLQFAYADWLPPEGGYLGIQACHYTTGTGWTKNPWGRIDAAIRWDYADSCSFENGVIAHLGGCGIELVTRCRNNKIEGNHIFDISGNGVMIGGPRDEANVPKNNRIANNHINACGIDYYGAVGVWVGFAQKTIISHNEIHDLPYSGISVGWQWNPKPTSCKENIIEYNHIYDVMNRLGDGGGIYTLGLQPGTVIRYNHIHDIHRSPLTQAAPNNGMFIDQGSKGYHFEGNVIYRTSAQPVRFNQCEREWHTWNNNRFGNNVPDLEKAIEKIRAKVGPEQTYRRLLLLDK